MWRQTGQRELIVALRAEPEATSASSFHLSIQSNVSPAHVSAAAVVNVAVSPTVVLSNGQGAVSATCDDTARTCEVDGYNSKALLFVVDGSFGPSRGTMRAPSPDSSSEEESDDSASVQSAASSSEDESEDTKMKLPPPSCVCANSKTIKAHTQRAQAQAATNKNKAQDSK